MIPKKPKIFKRKGFESRTFQKKSLTDKLYDNEWRSYSRRFLHHNKYCYACGRASQVTDHLRAHKGDLDLFWKTNNHIPMCWRCHSIVTQKFERNQVNFEGKLRWLAESRNERDLSFRVFVILR